MSVFWSRVKKQVGDDACWHWMGAVDNGYGKTYHDGRMRWAHRLAWEMVNGSIPDGLMVRHRCDNGVCVNPSHLLLGTHQDNMDDMVQRGRKLGIVAVAGDAHPMAKLTSEQVQFILALRRRHGFTSKELAAMYGVSKDIINKTVAGRNWRHVEDVWP